MGIKWNVYKEISVFCVAKMHQIKLTSISGSGSGSLISLIISLIISGIALNVIWRLVDKI